MQRTASHFLTQVHDRHGRLKFAGAWRKNLTTDSATGYTNRRDWEAKALGGGLAVGASAQGTLTGATATTATSATASFPVAGQGLAGQVVVVSKDATGAGSTVFGIIVSNTATALTVDRWWDATTLGLGTTPSVIGAYIVIPGQFPAMLLALTADATAPSASDQTLAGELTTGGLGRAVGTWAHVAAGTTYTLQKVFNSTTSATINKEAVFAAASGGAMPFESAEPSPPSLVSGDQLTQTVTVTIG